MGLGGCGGLELVEDVAVVLHVAAELGDVDDVGVVEFVGELRLLLVPHYDWSDCHRSHHVGDGEASLVDVVSESVLARVGIVLDVVAFAVDGVSFRHHGVEARLGAAEVEALLALEVVEEGEAIHRGVEVAVGGHLERGAGGRLRIGDQQCLGAKPGGGVGLVEAALLCGSARFEELTVLDDEGELPLGGWEKFALVVVHL